MNKRIKKKIAKRKKLEKRKLIDRVLRVAVPHFKVMMEVYSGALFLCSMTEIEKLKRFKKSF